MLDRWLRHPHGAILGLLLVALLFLLACGGGATSTPMVVEKEVVREVVKEVPKEVVVEKTVVVEKEVVREVVATPTPVPAPTQPPARVPRTGVHPGKVTWLAAAFGGEVFDTVGETGAGGVYGKILHGWLLNMDENWRLIPGIASEWGVSEDLRTWSWKIRKGLKFHDGREITAEDAYWTLMHDFGSDETGSSLDILVSGNQISVTQNTERIDIEGDTVSITGKQPFALMMDTYLSEMSQTWIGVQPKRDTFAWTTEDLQAYAENPVAAGPLKLTRHTPSERIEFERFDDYYFQPANGFPEDRRPNFSTFDLVLVPEESTRVAAVRAGEGDIAPVGVRSQAQIEAGGGRIVWAQEGVYLRAVLQGCWKPELPCSDRRVRQALAYAIDKELLQRELFGEEAYTPRGWSSVTPSGVGYSPEIDAFPFDPDKARQLMADAGYPNGEGFGKMVIYTWESRGTPFLPESALAAASMWVNELGIEVDVRLRDESDTMKRRLRDEQGNNDLIDGSIIWGDNEARRDSASIIASRYGNLESSSRVSMDPEIRDMVRVAALVFDPVERQEVYTQLYRRLSQEQYHLGMGYINIPWGVGPRVLEWQPLSLAPHPTRLHTLVLE